VSQLAILSFTPRENLQREKNTCCHINGKSYSCNRLWRRIELLDVKDPTLLVKRLTDGGDAVSPVHRLLVLISVRGSTNLRA
jgi:hypothetical protein